MRAFFAKFARLDYWRGAIKRFRDGLPRHWLHWVSAAVVWGLFIAYAWHWLSGNSEMLTNPALQNDDARTALFGFHRYEPSHALAHDPIAKEMLEFVPLGVRALYRILVPAVGLFVASKYVQGICLAITAYAGVVLVRSRRAGLGGGLLLVFLALHDTFFINRIAGGLPRAFGFPCFALWIAGAVAAKPWTRRTAIVLASVTYPSVMLMTLGAEGILAVRGAFRIPWRLVLRRLARYAVLVAVCLVGVLPALTLGGAERGPLYTLAQAKKEPAFGRSGRLWILPFSDPTSEFGRHFAAPLRPAGKPVLSPAAARSYNEYESAVIIAAIALLLLLPLLRLTPPQWACLTLFTSSALIYAASRIFAFHLYSPERYYSFGMRAAELALVTASFACLWWWSRSWSRYTVRNFGAALAMGGMWVVLGDGVIPKNGMTIDSRPDAALYDKIRKLPLDARIATHPMDGDNIPLFAERANVGGFETLQPWFVGSWHREKQRAEDTLRALYATRPEVVFRYAAKYHVSYFLINQARYGGNFRRASGSFQPLSAFAARILRDKTRNDLLFAQVPPSAVVFREGRFLLVDVKRLRRAWTGG